MQYKRAIDSSSSHHSPNQSSTHHQTSLARPSTIPVCCCCHHHNLPACLPASGPAQKMTATPPHHPHPPHAPAAPVRPQHPEPDHHHHHHERTPIGNDEASQRIQELLRRNGVQVFNQIGSGTHSRVFKSTLDKHIVAVKLIDLRKRGEYVDRFMERELKIIRQLDHPSIVKVFAIHRTTEFVAIVEEFAPNGDLLNFIRRKKERYLREDEAKQFFRQLIEAMIYMEHQHILHRDIKCENIFLDANNNIKVGDFGFTRELRTGEHSNTHCGSKPYAAVELLSGLPYVGNSVDIWSAGVVLYVMLTGCFPYGGANDDVDSIIKKQRLVAIKFPPRMSQAAISLILRMVDPKPEHRANNQEIASHQWLSSTPYQNKNGHAGH